MNLEELQRRAREIRVLYDTYHMNAGRDPWTRLHLAQGFVGDVGDLQKIVMAKEGLREMEDVDQKLAHELSDCLWSVLVLAEKYNVDLGSEFLKTMDELEARITQSDSISH